MMPTRDDVPKLPNRRPAQPGQSAWLSLGRTTGAPRRVLTIPRVLVTDPDLAILSEPARFDYWRALAYADRDAHVSIGAIVEAELRASSLDELEDAGLIEVETRDDGLIVGLRMLRML